MKQENEEIERDDDQMLADMDKLTSVEQIDKLGYNEDDYCIRRSEYPNCIHEYIAPRGY